MTDLAPFVAAVLKDRVMSDEQWVCSEKDGSILLIDCISSHSSI
jgi:hypothetical protein